MELMNDLVDEHGPLEKVTQKDYKRKLKPWINDDILLKISNENKIFKKYAKCKNIEDKKNLYEEYKILKNEITFLTRSNKKSYYDKYFSKNKENLRKTWQGIKEIINIKSKNYNSISCISENNVNITDPTKIANSFNKFYVSIADNILKKRKYAGKKSYRDFLKNPLSNSFVLEE